VDIQVANTNDFVAENVVVHNSWLEAMATKTPIIMPANTMLPEFITDETGWLVKSGSNPSLWTVIQFDNEVERPLTDVEDLVKVLTDIHANPEEAKRRAENAYEWVNKKMDWQRGIAPMWVKIFDKAYSDSMKTDADIEDVINQIGGGVIESEKF
jgi:glycosyltransferase involved in cell wall biosynthesis